MNVLDLFSGIGGFSLGLERAGMRTIGFCEIDPFCRAVLAKHWPDVPCHDDIRTFEPPAADVICGGFPCQDISVAGKGAGLAGARSGLWSELARIIGRVRPRYAIVENVSALLGRGLGEVLGDLAALGYDAEWHCIPTAAIGAPHRRDRVWIVAYPDGDELRDESGRWSWTSWASKAVTRNDGEAQSVAHSDDSRQLQPQGREPEGRRRSRDGCADMGDPYGAGLPQREASPRETRDSRGGWSGDFAAISSQWFTEPDVGRVAHGIPMRVDRLKSLGNAVVPQVVQIIGEAIMKSHADSAILARQDQP